MERRVAVFVDGDNLSPDLAPEVRRHADELGTPFLRRVYCNATQLKGWEKRADFLVVHSGSGKNATDLLLAVDAMEIAFLRALRFGGDREFRPRLPPPRDTSAGTRPDGCRRGRQPGTPTPSGMCVRALSSWGRSRLVPARRFSIARSERSLSITARTIKACASPSSIRSCGTSTTCSSAVIRKRTGGNTLAAVPTSTILIRRDLRHGCGSSPAASPEAFPLRPTL
jgi:hypothetical protein